MSWELVYTSVPQGLKPGSRGFCAVAQTRGIPAALLERLESLSGYRHLFAPQDPNARLNPPAWSHLLVNLGGKRYHLLSYVGDAGLDYSQRTNKLAHHVACEPNELTPAGPAGSLQQPGFLLTQWQSEPAQWPAGRALPRGETRPGPCANWQRVAGDAGWSGILAETIFNRREVNVIFQPGMPVLNLFAEAIALLPPPKRWEATFQTFYTGLPQGVDCRWRGIVAGSDEEALARRNANALLIDLTRQQAAPPSAAATAAREGRLVEPLKTLDAAPSPTRPANIPQAQTAPQPAYGQRVRTGYPAAPQADLNTYELQPLDGVAGPPGMNGGWDSRYSQRVNRGKTWMIVAAVVAVLAVLGTAGGAYWVINNGSNKTQTALQQENLPQQLLTQPSATKPSPQNEAIQPDRSKIIGNTEPEKSEDEVTLENEWPKIKDQIIAAKDDVAKAAKAAADFEANRQNGNDDLEQQHEKCLLQDQKLKEFKALVPKLSFQRPSQKFCKAFSNLNNKLNMLGIDDENVATINGILEVDRFSATDIEKKISENMKLKKELDKKRSELADKKAVKEFLDKLNAEENKFVKDKHIPLSENTMTESAYAQLSFALANVDQEMQYGIKPIKDRQGEFGIFKSGSDTSGSDAIAYMNRSDDGKVVFHSPRIINHPALKPAFLVISDKTASENYRLIPLFPPEIPTGKPPDNMEQAPLNITWNYPRSGKEQYKILVSSIRVVDYGKITSPVPDVELSSKNSVAEYQGYIPYDTHTKRITSEFSANSFPLGLSVSCGPLHVIYYHDNKPRNVSLSSIITTRFNFSELRQHMDEYGIKDPDIAKEININHVLEQSKKVDSDIVSLKAKIADLDMKQQGHKEETARLNKLNKEAKRYEDLKKLQAIFPIGYYTTDGYNQRIHAEISSQLKAHCYYIKAFRVIEIQNPNPNGKEKTITVDIPLPMPR